MPRGDGTGPRGQGPMTGRAAGICAGNDVPGFMNPIPGRGLGGRGRGGGGGGWGRRNWFHTEPSRFVMTEHQEAGILKSQAEYFANALEGIKKRIEELEARAPGNE